MRQSPGTSAHLTLRRAASGRSEHAGSEASTSRHFSGTPPDRTAFARLAAFLQDVDKIGGKWCVAHPTYCRATAEAAAKRLTPRLPGRSVMELARAAKREYMLGVIRTQSADETIKEISAEWKRREEMK